MKTGGPHRLKDIPEAAISRKKYPLLGQIIDKKQNKVTFEREFSLSNDLYLNHHRLPDEPLLPGVIALELFSQIGSYLYPHREFNRLQDIEFKKAIVFQEEKTQKIRTKSFLSRDNGKVVLNNQLKIVRENATEKPYNMCGKVIFGARETKQMETPQVKKRPFLPKEFLYQILPHGPLFQPIAEINRIDSKLVTIYNNIRERFFSWRHKKINLPILALEAGFQSTGIIDFIDTGITGLPFRIKNISIYQQRGKPHYIIGKKKSQKEKGSLFDFKVLTKKGIVLLAVEDFETRNVSLGDTSSYLEKLRSHKLRQMFYLPKKSWLEVISLSLLKEKLSQEQDFPRTFLHPQEQKEIVKYKKEKQLIDLAKIFAMKRCLKLLNKRFQMNENIIKRDDFEEPYFQFKRKKIYFTLLQEDNYVFAMMGYKRKIGIALSKKMERKKSIQKTILDQKEKQVIQERKQKNQNSTNFLEILVAKEAVQNTIGKKSSLQLDDIVLTDIRRKHLIFTVNRKKYSKQTIQHLSNHLKEGDNFKVITQQNNHFVTAVSEKK